MFTQARLVTAVILDCPAVFRQTEMVYV